MSALSSSSLAFLWRDQGKPQHAGELLAPVYDWFTEGFDTRDLKEEGAAGGVERVTHQTPAAPNVPGRAVR
jgi:hypothetical protein